MHLHLLNQDQTASIHRSIKMRLSTEEIKQFVANNATVYPHHEIKCTRTGFCCKWIVLQARGRNSDVLRTGEGHLHSLPTACLDAETLQSLVVSKAAVPLSNESADVEDCMSIWGRNISERWHQLVLNLLCSPTKRTRKEMCRLCIQIRVNDLIRDRLSLQPVLAHLVLLQWGLMFGDVHDCVTKEFFELCMRSFHFVVIKTNEALSPAGLAPLDAVSSDEDDSSVHCIPVVSSSSD